MHLNLGKKADIQMLKTAETEIVEIIRNHDDQNTQYKRDKMQHRVVSGNNYTNILERKHKKLL